MVIIPFFFPSPLFFFGIETLFLSWVYEKHGIDCYMLFNVNLQPSLFKIQEIKINIVHGQKIQFQLTHY